MTGPIDYDALPATDLLRAAKNVGISFDHDRFGQPAVRCPWPAPPPVPAIYDACVRRSAELAGRPELNNGEVF